MAPGPWLLVKDNLERFQPSCLSGKFIEAVALDDDGKSCGYFVADVSQHVKLGNAIHILCTVRGASEAVCWEWVHNQKSEIWFYLTDGDRRSAYKTKKMRRTYFPIR